MINDKINIFFFFQSSFEMLELEFIDLLKRNICDKEIKSKKDLENLIKKRLNLNELRFSGVYFYVSLKSNEIRCSLLGDNNVFLIKIYNKLFIFSEKIGIVLGLSLLQQSVSLVVVSGYYVMKLNFN